MGGGGGGGGGVTPILRRRQISYVNSVAKIPMYTIVVVEETQCTLFLEKGDV